MKRICATSAFALLALAGWALMTPAGAAPPTVTPSPGYDARLQESRAATATPVLPIVKPPPRRARRMSAH